VRAGLFREQRHRFDPGEVLWRRSGSMRTSLPEKVWTSWSRATRRRGEKRIDEAKKIDPKAVEEPAEEVERDKENAERFTNKK
jgi:hypothetical protein